MRDTVDITSIGDAVCRTVAYGQDRLRQYGSLVVSRHQTAQFLVIAVSVTAEMPRGRMLNFSVSDAIPDTELVTATNFAQVLLERVQLNLLRLSSMVAEGRRVSQGELAVHLR